MNDLQSAYEQLLKRNYRDSLCVRSDKIWVAAKQLFLEKKYLFFDAALKFENDTRILYAVSSPKVRVKGLLIIDGETNKIPTELIGKLPFETDLFINDGREVLNYQYGMRKVSLQEFETDPERYQFRTGFENFPACPFGHTFKSLGFDLKEQEYVRFAKKIIKKHPLELIRPKNE